MVVHRLDASTMTVSEERKNFLHNYKQIIYLVIVSLVLGFLCGQEGSVQTGVVIYPTDIDNPIPNSFTPQVPPVTIY